MILRSNPVSVVPDQLRTLRRGSILDMSCSTKPVCRLQVRGIIGSTSVGTLAASDGLGAFLQVEGRTKAVYFANLCTALEQRGLLK